MFATYRLSDKQFLRGWPNPPPYDEATEGIQEYPDHLRPDHRTERFHAGVKDKKRPATAQEMTDYDAARVEVREQAQFEEHKMLKAVALWVADKMAVDPATAKAEILARYRAMGGGV